MTPRDRFEFFSGDILAAASAAFCTNDPGRERLQHLPWSRVAATKGVPLVSPCSNRRSSVQMRREGARPLVAGLSRWAARSKCIDARRRLSAAIVVGLVSAHGA